MEEWFDLEGKKLLKFCNHELLDMVPYYFELNIPIPKYCMSFPRYSSRNLDCVDGNLPAIAHIKWIFKVQGMDKLQNFF